MSQDQPEGMLRLQRLATLYTRYAGDPDHTGKSPPNERAFKDFINRKLTSEERAALKVDNVDALFISPRDNQPYVIVYGQASGLNELPPDFAGGEGSSPPPAPPAQVVAYEKVGSGGKRYVAFATGAVEEVDAGKAAELKLK